MKRHIEQKYTGITIERVLNVSESDTGTSSLRYWHIFDDHYSGQGNTMLTAFKDFTRQRNTIHQNEKLSYTIEPLYQIGQEVYLVSENHKFIKGVIEIIKVEKTSDKCDIKYYIAPDVNNTVGLPTYVQWESEICTTLEQFREKVVSRIDEKLKLL